MIASCVAGGPSEQVKEEKLPIVEFVDSFKISHPNWGNNSITEEQANEDYIKMIEDTALLYSLTEGIEVKLSGMRKDKKGQITAHFTAWQAQENVKKYDISKVMFDVVTNINDSLVSSLKEGKKYICKWDIVSPVNYGAFCVIYGEQVSTIDSTPEIELGRYGLVEISLGLFYANIVEIKPKY